MEAAPGFEPGNGSFANSCLTTWLSRLEKICLSSSIKAGDGIRTRDSHLGKVALYQLSYSRMS